MAPKKPLEISFILSYESFKLELYLCLLQSVDAGDSFHKCYRNVSSQKKVTTPILWNNHTFYSFVYYSSHIMPYESSYWM